MDDFYTIITNFGYELSNEIIKNADSKKIEFINKNRLLPTLLSINIHKGEIINVLFGPRGSRFYTYNFIFLKYKLYYLNYKYAQKCEVEVDHMWGYDLVEKDIDDPTLNQQWPDFKHLLKCFLPKMVKSARNAL